jgi:DNA damage-binding protein 1
MDLSSSPSTLLPSTVVSAKYLLLSDSLPYLIHVPSSGQDCGYPGGVLLLGSKKIQFFQFADGDLQEKLKGKQRRTEGRKKSADLAEAQRAKQKESERASRKRKPKATIQWPWSEITACIIPPVTFVYPSPDHDCAGGAR